VDKQRRKSVMGIVLAGCWSTCGARRQGKQVVFTLDSSLEPSELAADVVDESTSQELTEYVESSLSLETDLEDQIVSHLDALEPGLTLVSRQVRSEVGILDLLAKSRMARQS
jgi:RecB family endonuclease NucS